MKSKGEKERYTHLNIDFQRISRREKKAFLSNQYKEKNRMGKTGDLFKKIRDTKGTFHANMGTIKDRNGMDLIEAEDIKKMWQKKILMTHITTSQTSWSAKSRVPYKASLRTKLVEVRKFQLSYFKS